MIDKSQGSSAMGAGGARERMGRIAAKKEAAAAAKRIESDAVKSSAGDKKDYFSFHEHASVRALDLKVAGIPGLRKEHRQYFRSKWEKADDKGHENWKNKLVTRKEARDILKDMKANPSKHPVKPQVVDRVAKQLGINIEDL